MKPSRNGHLPINGLSLYYGGCVVAAGMVQNVPAARLVILPAMSHLGILGASAVLAPMVRAFLDDVPPPQPDVF